MIAFYFITVWLFSKLWIFPSVTVYILFMPLLFNLHSIWMKILLQSSIFVVFVPLLKCIGSPRIHRFTFGIFCVQLISCLCINMHNLWSVPSHSGTCSWTWGVVSSFELTVAFVSYCDCESVLCRSGDGFPPPTAAPVTHVRHCTPSNPEAVALWSLPQVSGLIIIVFALLLIFFNNHPPPLCV